MSKKVTTEQSGRIWEGRRVSGAVLLLLLPLLLLPLPLLLRDGRGFTHEPLLASVAPV